MTFLMVEGSETRNRTKAGWRPLSRIRTRILRAVIAAMGPLEHGFDQSVGEDVLRDTEIALFHLPTRQRICLGGGLWLMEYGPPVYARRLRRFSKMERAEAQRYLASWERARGARATVFRGIKFIVFLSFYQHPEVLASLGIGWVDRAATLSRLRAELLQDRLVEDWGGG